MFGRRALPPGEDIPGDPRDDAEDFHVSDAQRRIRATAQTRAQMAKVWEAMQANLRDPWQTGKPLRFVRW